ncbi:hypothetical protein BASA81_002648 [Batrachochytrium salamandrivorans]|nr:hypothetical protein BASA81_002648 [Batrachochytrium salamandrivorans]
MQVVLNANKASYVQNALVKGGTQELYYYVPPSDPNISKANHELQPFIGFSGAPDNNTHTFNITRAGYHYLGRVKYTGTKTFALNESQTFSIFNMIRNVQWVSNGQPILNMDGEAFKAMVMNNTAPFQEHAHRYCRALNPLTERPIATAQADNVQFVTYLPLFGSWYTTIEKALNTTELEQIQVSITYKTFSESGMSVSPTIFNAKFENYTYMPDTETYNKMVAKDYASPIIMQCFNTFTERRPIGVVFNAGATTRIEVISEVVVPAYKTHIFVAKTNTQATDPVFGCPLVPISAVSVAMGGDYYVSNYSKSMMNYEQAVRGNSCHTVGPTVTTTLTESISTVGFNENQCITIDWSLGCSRDEATGLASMANLNKPVYSIDVGPYTAPAGENVGSYWVFLVHEYWNILQVQPGTKTLAIVAAV